MIHWAITVPRAAGRIGNTVAKPVIVVSNDGFNGHFPIVTIVSATKAEGKKRQRYPFEVVLPAGTITLEHKSIVMPHQVRTISKMHLLERIGTLEDNGFREAIENRLLEHLDIVFEEESVDDIEK